MTIRQNHTCVIYRRDVTRRRRRICTMSTNDWATRRDVESALRMLAGAYPAERVPIDGDVAEAWLRDLHRFPGVVVLEAASQYDGERFPNRVQFFEACQRTARARILAQANEHHAERQQALPVAPPFDVEVARELVAIMREALFQSVEPADHVRHDAHGVGECPVCTMKAERVAAITAEADRMMRERGLIAVGQATFRCIECHDSTAVLIDETTNTTRPCSTCTPTGFLLWQAGHCRPGHICDGCSTPRKRHELAAVLAGQHGTAPQHEQIGAAF